MLKTVCKNIQSYLSYIGFSKTYLAKMRVEIIVKNSDFGGSLSFKQPFDNMSTYWLRY